MDSRRKNHHPASIEPHDERPAEIEDLKNTELYRDVHASVIELTRPTSRICSLEPGQRLHTTRKGVDYLYIIIRGYVSIWTRSYFNPGKDVFLAWRGPEHILGELRQLGDPPSNTEIQACDHCEFIEIRLDTFLDLAKNNCFLYRNVANLILRKMWHEGQRSEVIQTIGVRQQVAKSLIHLAQDRSYNFSLDESIVEIPGTIYQDELGFYVGASRHSVNVALNDLKLEGVIALDGGNKGCQITILRLQELFKEIQTPPSKPKSKKSTRKLKENS